MPGQRKKKRGGGVVILAVLLPVVLILAGVGGVVYFRGIGPLGPFTGSSIKAERELTQAMLASFDRDHKIADGLGNFATRWWTDKHLVRTMPNKVVAYDLATGKVAWEVGVPQNHYCPASAQPSANGYVALLRGTREEGCRKVTVVDIDNGKEVWSKDIPPLREGSSNVLVTDFPRYDHRPAILGERLYIPTAEGGHIWNLADGKVLQNPNLESECYTTHYDAIGETGFAYRNCSRSGDKGRNLTGFDASGKPTWKWDLPKQNGGKQYLLVGVLSADPLLVRVSGEGRKDEIWQVEPGGLEGPGTHKLVVDISKTSLHDQVASDPCGPVSSDGLHSCPEQLVSKGVLYLQYSLGEQSNGKHRGLAAYDIKTGKELWKVAWDTEHNVTAPIGVDDNGRPLVYLPPVEKDPGALVAVDPEDGRMTAVATVAVKPFMTSGATASTTDWHDGYLAFFTTQAGEKDAGSRATLVYK
jgi:outer membrane protein assembly factor BamB